MGFCCYQLLAADSAPILFDITKLQFLNITQYYWYYSILSNTSQYYSYYLILHPKVILEWSWSDPGYYSVLQILLNIPILPILNHIDNITKNTNITKHILRMLLIIPNLILTPLQIELIVSCTTSASVNCPVSNT